MRTQLRVTVRQLDITRQSSRYVGSKVKGAGGKRPFLHLSKVGKRKRENRVGLALQSNFTVGYPVRKSIPRNIMGEAPRARNTAQNTLTTWHANRLYGAF